ncbi:MAG TPA: isoaspartyl peptidase/L-asparaginase [Aggregatilineales bacterium]|nr:isoaspartyl peptidase/L-asparaginase [Aggregatilineales bacterium]
MTIRLLAHGGAGAWVEADTALALEGMRAAVEAGWRVLRGGGSALDAIEQTVIVLEDYPVFDAGIGSYLNQRGEVEMDAIITDGSALNFGAVAAIQRIRHPISLARLVMTQTDHCFLVADGAEELAVHLGMPLVPNMTFVTDAKLAAFRKWMAQTRAPIPAIGTGTVGAVALDATGRVASATSTGGTALKRKGRVGDTPIFGAGAYADRHGAASGTGRGEDIMRGLLCKDAVDQIKLGQSASEAAQTAIDHLIQRFPHGSAGVILVDSNGGLGAAHSTPFMPVAWIDERDEIHVSMDARSIVF